MKKLISLLLAMVMVAAMAAGCSQNANKETTAATTEATTQATTEAATEPETTAAAVELEGAVAILSAIWNEMGEANQFPVVGGDNAYHLAQMEKDETYVMPSTPGKFDLAQSEELTYTMLVPTEEQSNITDAATMIHMMNSNNFSSGVYTVGAEVAANFAAAMKSAVLGNQWMCGMPETLLIAVIDSENVLVVWGVNDAMTLFVPAFEAVYPNAQVIVNEAIAG